jgi:3-hydroxymyristoyl/3-hydroxydecanoyl-(acyl carrier protein) dehydratase
LKIPGTHPALAGHFPGAPIIPGVVIIDHVISAVSELKGKPVRVNSIPSIKFLSPIGPDEEFEISLTEKDSGKVIFSVSSNDRKILTGSLVCS